MRRCQGALGALIEVAIAMVPAQLIAEGDESVYLAAVSWEDVEIHTIPDPKYPVLIPVWFADTECVPK